MKALPHVAIGIAASLTMLAQIPAQLRHVVPLGCADTEQASKVWLPGLGYDGRMQLIIDSASLTALVGHNLTGLEFRRESARPLDQEAGSATVLVRIGQATTAPFGASADFAANCASPSTVYQGPMASAYSSVTGYAGWEDPHVIRVVFSQPYAYGGGHLTIDLEASASAHVWWPVDAAVDPTIGQVHSIGSPCGAWAANHLGRTILTSESSLVVGGTFATTEFLPAQSAGLLLFGLGALQNPIDLASLGSPGCSLFVDPLVAVSPSSMGVEPTGEMLAEFRLRLPADAGLFGATFAVQGLALSAQGLTTTEALHCQVAGNAPVLGCAVVSAVSQESPRLDTHLVPVLGILHD
ncbi:MAG: hypothetical protein U1F36_07210 [Planctomycetota bacterium]